MPRSVAEWLAQIEAESTDLDREAADLVAAETTARAAAARRQRMAATGELPRVPGPFVVRDGRRLRVADWSSVIAEQAEQAEQ